MRHGNPAGTSHSGASGSLKYGNAVAQTLEERKSATVGPLPGIFFGKVGAVWTCNEDDINPVRITASAPEAIAYSCSKWLPPLNRHRYTPLQYSG